jgi:hypothetical protein
MRLDGTPENRLVRTRTMVTNQAFMSLTWERLHF